MIHKSPDLRSFTNAMEKGAEMVMVVCSINDAWLTGNNTFDAGQLVGITSGSAV